MPAFPSNCVRWVFALLAVTAGAKPASAQSDEWSRLIAAADSIGPLTPRTAPTRRTECAAGVQRADSVEVRAPAGEFLLFSRSLRTRGMFSSVDAPSRGTARFALRQVYCDAESGRPVTFIVERDHRFFYLVFNLHDPPTYRSLRYVRELGEAYCVAWDPSGRQFAMRECQPVPGSKC